MIFDTLVIRNEATSSGKLLVGRCYCDRPTSTFDG